MDTDTDTSADTRADTSADTEMTTTAKRRHELLATLVAGTSVVTFLALVVGASLGVVTLNAVGAAWYGLFGVLVATSAAYALGRKKLLDWRAEN